MGLQLINNRDVPHPRRGIMYSAPTLPIPDQAPEPTLAEKRQAMAQDGDVEGLWRVLSDTPHSLIDAEGTFRLLLRAIEVSARRDPAAFSQATFARLVGFTAYLSLR